MRWVRVLLIGLLGGAAISLFAVVRHPYVREIRASWLAERPLAVQFRNHGCRFNEIIWWTPENGESFLPFYLAYKYYRQVQHNRFTKTDVSGVPFGRLNEFEHLDSIDLTDTNIRADQLAEMCNRQWVQIDLCRTKLTRAGLQSLVTTNRLVYLSLAGSSVTDDMLSALTTLSVHVFSLADTQVGDPGMDLVGKMPGLNRLDLARTKVGDNGLQSLSQRTFSALNFSGTAVSDSGLKYLNTRSPGSRLDLNGS